MTDQILRESVVTVLFFRTEIARLENRMTLRMGWLIMSGVALLASIKFFG